MSFAFEAAATAGSCGLYCTFSSHPRRHMVGCLIDILKRSLHGTCEDADHDTLTCVLSLNVSTNQNGRGTQFAHTRMIAHALTQIHTHTYAHT